MTGLAMETLKSQLEISELKRLRLKRRQFLDGSEAENLNLWSMLDLMTLILVFFIILYTDLLSVNHSVPSENLIKPEARQNTRFISHNHDIKKIRRQKSVFPSIEKDIYKIMEGTDISDYSIETSDNRIKLVIGEKISFPAGQAKLLEDIKGPLQKLAEFFNRETNYRIIISGHTDNTPIHTNLFPSNWELSVVRALSVAKLLMRYNVNPGRISVEGFGQYRPIADNSNYEGRQANRRVEISVVTFY